MKFGPQVAEGALSAILLAVPDERRHDPALFEEVMPNAGARVEVEQVVPNAALLGGRVWQMEDGRRGIR